MQESKIKCECGSSYIVNKKFGLCGDCNFKRLHNGKSKHQVYSERSLFRVSQRQVDQNKKEGTRGKCNKPKNRINPISSSNKYRCSSGELVSQIEINKNLKEVYKYIDLDRLPICQGCNSPHNPPLSHSHTISQARCKSLGKTELIWDEENIEIECFGAPSSNPTECHNIWEVSNLEMKKTLFNFKKKLEYIKIHDQETYKKLTWSLI